MRDAGKGKSSHNLISSCKNNIDSVELININDDAELETEVPTNNTREASTTTNFSATTVQKDIKEIA